MIKKGLPVKKAIDATTPTKKIVICDPKTTSGKRKSSETLSPGLHNATMMKLALLKRKTEEAKKRLLKRFYSRK